MGVSGSGKSTVGKRVADTLGLTFVEGDEFHPPENVAKMSAGQPLTDVDRGPWVDALAASIAAYGNRDVIVACSALSRFVRQRLRQRVSGPLCFIHLSADPEVIQRRLDQRPKHFMKAGMLASQFAALETPRGAVTIDTARSLDHVCTSVIQHIRAVQGAQEIEG